MIESVRDTQKHIGIDWLLSKNVIYIGALAVYFACKPCGGAFLALKFPSYYFSDMYHKKGGTICCRSSTGAPPSALNTDKHKQLTPIQAWTFCHAYSLYSFNLAVSGWENKSKKLKIHYVVILLIPIFLLFCVNNAITKITRKYYISIVSSKKSIIF